MTTTTAAGSSSRHEKFKSRIDNNCLENSISVPIGAVQQVIYRRSSLTPSIFSNAGYGIKINTKYSIRINKIYFLIFSDKTNILFVEIQRQVLAVFSVISVMEIYAVMLLCTF